MPRKIAIGFVIYVPSMKQLNRIHEASHLGFSVYVYDNTAERSNFEGFARNRGNIVYLTCGKNVGLGLGMASVCAQAYYDGYSALLFFDQDTVFTTKTLEFIEDFYVRNKRSSLDYSAWVFKPTSRKDLNPQKDVEIRDVMLAINSGSLFFLDNARRFNWHDESYFVDCVDYSFCLRTRRAGLKVGEISGVPDFDHVAEQGDSRYIILGKEYLFRPYSAKRIVDTMTASTRLVFDSFIQGDFAFSAKITWLFTIYLVAQILVRVYPKKTISST
jgi:hypothetical protein